VQEYRTRIGLLGEFFFSHTWTAGGERANRVNVRLTCKRRGAIFTLVRDKLKIAAFLHLKECHILLNICTLLF